ncbi:hypothetical protein MKW94_007255 [Papaver nudicaule]|uniref:Uncharacterized protein n=1 Tax=Papaver nudicaule TaxID=74823 RepID=A0AA41S545_PAPNU|nr:hypothetical protein [Papaver nudicaule]
MSEQEEKNVAELKIGEEFLKAKCLMNYEVALIIDRKYDQLQAMSSDPMSQASHVLRSRSNMSSVKRFSRYKNADAVRQVREYPSCFQSCSIYLFYLLAKP